MFKKQIEELIVKEESVVGEIEELEGKLKSKKFEQRDIKSAITSLTRLQDKYSDEIENEASTVSV